MAQSVHVTVQTATVGLAVEVSALHEMQQVMHSSVCVRYLCRAFFPLLFSIRAFSYLND